MLVINPHQPQVALATPARGWLHMVRKMGEWVPGRFKIGTAWPQEPGPDQATQSLRRLPERNLVARTSAKSEEASGGIRDLAPKSPTEKKERQPNTPPKPYPMCAWR